MNQNRSLTALKVLAVVAAFNLLVLACSSDSDDDTTVQTTSTTSTTSTEATTTTQATTTTEATTTVPAPTSTTMAGTPGAIGPRAGDQIAVVGVAHDDTLNIRQGPGVDQPVVAEAEPLEDNVVAAGNNRSLPSSIWSEVTVGGTTGWANSRFLAYLGDTYDATSQVVRNHGSLPSGSSIDEITDLVLDSRQYEGEGLRIEISQAPTDGDLSEMVVDIIGFEDDSILGERLHVFAQAEGSVLGLKSVEATILCARGVSTDLLCL